MIDIQQNSPIELLQKLGFWKSGEHITHTEVPGESNINLVLRIKTNLGSYILKQSKPFVRKYPQIPAPISRIEVEYRFLELLSTDPYLASLSPKVLDYDSNAHLMLLEDLGEGSDYLSIYGGARQLQSDELIHLVEYLMHLHQVQVTEFPDTVGMRTLNHEHIFEFPFLEENGFDLDQIQLGLQKRAYPTSATPYSRQKFICSDSATSKQAKPWFMEIFIQLAG